MNDNLKNDIEVGGQKQRLLIGVFLPIVLLHMWYFLYTVPFEEIRYVFLVSAVLFIPLTILSTITEALQKRNTFSFIIFSILLVFAYMIITLSTAWLWFIFLMLVPVWLISLPFLRLHYLYHKKEALKEIAQL